MIPNIHNHWETGYEMAAKSIYHRNWFPPEIISHCVWLYFRFTLSFRDVDELMVAPGIAGAVERLRNVRKAMVCVSASTVVSPIYCAPIISASAKNCRPRFPQKSLGHISPIRAMKNWQQSNPHLFKIVVNLPGRQMPYLISPILWQNSPNVLEISIHLFFLMSSSHCSIITLGDFSSKS